MRRKALVGMLFICTMILFLSGIVGITSAGDWPMFGHDPRHSGTTDENVPDDLELLWTYETEEGWFMPPAVADGKVFAANCFKIYCLDENTGKLIWSYPAESYYSSPAVADGKVFFGSDQIYCLDENTGKLIWSYDYETGADFYFGSAPVVTDGKVFIGYDKIYCLNEDTGELIWSYKTGYGCSSPAVSNDKVFVISDKIYCLDKNNGEMVWNWSYGTYHESIPFPYSLAVADGKVFFGPYCLDKNTGELIWSYKNEGFGFSPCAVANGKMFFNIYSNPGEILCLDENTGELIWSYEVGMCMPRKVFWPSSPVVADNKVFASSLNTKTYCLNGSTGELIWSYETGYHAWSAPVVANSKIFVVSSENIYCFGSKEEIPGFEAIFAIIGLLAIAYILRRKK